VSGSLLGRIMSEIIRSKFPNAFADFPPGMFALVGAASFAGGLTRAVSSCVIVAETQPHLLVPVAIGVLTSYFVANRISKPVYDALVETDEYPMISRKLRYDTGIQSVGSIMKSVNISHVLKPNSTIREAQRVLELCGSQMFPVVRLAEKNAIFLIGEVQRRDLLIAIEHLQNHIQDTSLLNNEDDIMDDDEESGEDVSLLRRRRRRQGSLLDETLPYTCADGTSSPYFAPKSASSGLNFNITVDLCPMSISNHTTIHKVRVLFRALRLTALYVHDDSNRLIGSISRNRFIHAVRKL